MEHTQIAEKPALPLFYLNHKIYRMKEPFLKRYKHILIILLLISLIVVSGCGGLDDEDDKKMGKTVDPYQGSQKQKEDLEKMKWRDEDTAESYKERVYGLKKTDTVNIKEKIKLYEAGPPEEIFTNTNIYSVQNGAESPSFSILESTKIAMVKTYHWNNAQGKAPGTIGLADKNGKSYGPWKASSEPGQGGVKSAYWKVTPNIELPGGIYTIIDSDPSTWAQNKESKGEGMVWVFAATKKED